jgi:nucleotide-binding universal stress UspA family protein
MYKHILLPIDGSAASDSAAAGCMQFARAIGARITALHSIPPLHLFTYEPGVTETAHEYIQKQEALAKQWLAAIEQAAAQAGVPCETMLVVADQPFEAIIETARTRQCDLITMGSHGHKGIAGLLLGSQTQKVLMHSLIPVLVYR